MTFPNGKRKKKTQIYFILLLEKKKKMQHSNNFRIKLFALGESSITELKHES